MGCDQKGTTWARAHQCTKVREPYKKTASNRCVAPSDPRAPLPMSQETNVTIHYDPEPLLPGAGLHVPMHGGVYSRC